MVTINVLLDRGVILVHSNAALYFTYDMKVRITSADVSYHSFQSRRSERSTEPTLDWHDRDT